MRRPIRVSVALLAWVMSPMVSPAEDPATSAESASLTSYVVISGGAQVGTLAVTRAQTTGGQAIDTRYLIRENGRGPDLHESISIDPQGQLLSFHAQGTSTFLAAVDERYEWSDGLGSWSAASETEQRRVEQALFYIPNHSSPLIYELLINQASNTGDFSLTVLPEGRVQIEHLDSIDLDGLSEPLSLYMVSGLSLEPDFIVLDQQGQLAARLALPQLLLREDLAHHADHFIELSETRTHARIAALTEQLGIRPSGRVVFDQVHVVSPRADTTTALLSVAVVDGRITAIDEEIPVLPGDLRVDGQGGYLAPGLYDMHVHATPWTGPYFLAAGIVGVRDQGNVPERMQAMLAAQEAGQALAPRIFPSGLIEGLSLHSTKMGKVVDSLEAALAAIDAYAEQGYRQIKLYNSVRPQWVKPLIERAHDLGMKVTGHVPAFMTADQAIVAGYDDISHLNQLMLGWLLTDGEDTRTPLRITAMTRAAELSLRAPRVLQTFDLMVAHGVALDTTAIIMERVFLSRAGQVPEADLPYLDHMPIGYQRFRRQGVVSIPSPQIDVAYQKAFEVTLATMTMAHQRGIQFLPGSDDGTGFALHRELELYVRAGLTPAEALSAATDQAAAYLGIADEAGAIEVGKRADMLLVADNPLENISALRRVRLVSFGDRLFRADALYRTLGVRPFSTPPPIKEQ